MVLHMIRVQVQLSEAQVLALREQAAAAERTVAALVREAIDAWLASQDRSARIDRAMAAIGGFHSGQHDLAENHDRYLEETTT